MARRDARVRIRLTAGKHVRPERTEGTSESAYDMDPTLQQQSVFHLTGKRPPAGLDGIEGLRPALLARYRDLAKLRYDFPLVLVAGDTEEVVRSLSSVVDGLIREIAPPGLDGEGLRRQLLRVERDIRRLLAAGTQGTLATLWEQVVGRLGREPGGAKLAALLEQAAGALHVDGELADCDRLLPLRLITHAWRSEQVRKARRARADINAMIVRLTDILRADFVRSTAGCQPESLREAFGGGYREMFDFVAMSRLLGHGPFASRLPDARRRRIEGALTTLRSQHFFGVRSGDAATPGGEPPYEFAFSHGADAVAAFRSRLPAMVELVKAMSLAALEADGRYVEATHDAFFDAFDAQALGPRDIELFPEYLVCLESAREAPEQLTLMELLSAGIPVKVLVQVNDLFEDAGLGEGHSAFGLRSVDVASAAVGLNDCFVLQSASSNLYQVRRSVARGLSYPGPALFSVFSGAAPGTGGLPPYLVAAAAMQSRAFPAFSYDPSAGAGLADRFSLEENPQPLVDWPVTELEFADGELQRVTEPATFTFLDFVACDARHARHFARAPHNAWNGHMVPVADWLVQAPPAGSDQIPYLLAVDEQDVLQRVIADDHVIQAARRCRETWRRLQELGGVRSSHAERLLERERTTWEAQKLREIDAIRSAAVSVPSAPSPAPEAIGAPAAAPSAVAAAPAAAERSKDEAYIDTIRCSTCNECTQINDRMFAYNDDKQAYIKDLSAGTYAQLVDAAESCQLSIIHPGKPRDPNEPGLAELLERAQPFV